MNAIEVKNLKKYFKKTRAVDDVTFEVQKGEIFGFLGPNGAGKTTTIRCLMDFLRPTEGEVRLLGMDYHREAQEIKKKIGYLSGDVRLYDGWTGEDHINFLQKLRGKKSIATQLSERLNFNPKIKFKALSSGNKQKLGLILALCFEPELLIMDEPTVGLDPLLQNSIYLLLQEFQQKGTTIFFSSHNLTEVDKLCHRVGIIKQGKIVTIESIQTLKDKRMHIVKIYFNGLYNPQDFVIENVEIKNEANGFIELGVRGDINPLFRKLANYNLKEIEISHATLEDIFLEFYGQNGFTNHRNQEKQDNLNKIPKIE